MRTKRFIHVYNCHPYYRSDFALSMRGIILFIRTEKSIKEFFEYYPIVSIFVIINFALWAIVHLLPFELGPQIYQWGAGHNLSIYQNGEYWRLFTPIFLQDRKSTRLNSSHVAISYAVFCLKKTKPPPT